MRRLTVRFEYVPGVKNPPFENVRLLAGWNADGQPADEHQRLPMDRVDAPDGQVRFVAEFDFPEASSGRDFRWGVVLDSAGRRDLWGIMTEARDPASSERYCWFHLHGAIDALRSVQTETYYLTHCRRMGANKHFYGAESRPGIRFACWAPNARNVEVVLGTIWDARDSQSKPTRGPLPIEEIRGGYIADDGTGIDLTRGPFAMYRGPDGTWVTDPDDPALIDFHRFDHCPYMFRVTKDDGTIVYRTDLYSRCQIGSGLGTENPRGKPYDGRVTHLDGTVSCSVVVDPDLVCHEFHEWREDRGRWVAVWPEQQFVPEAQFWTDEFDSKRPVPKRVEDLIIYELHIGALGFGRDGVGTIEDAIGLLDYLEDLGVNAIELLPLSEFGGHKHFWGYSTSHYFAIEYSGGGRDKFKHFVRECHRRGFAVIMDVVYNHYVHAAERAQWLFDSNSHDKNIYYWYEGTPFDYPEYERLAMQAASGDGEGSPAAGHGGYIDNLSTGYAPAYHEEAVRKQFISSAVSLMQEFHVDGFRVDQTTSIHAYNQRHADGAPMSHVNAFGVKFLRELTSTLLLINPAVILIAEDHSGWDRVTVPVEQGGLGFHASWFADFYHHLIGDAADKGMEWAKLLKTIGGGYDGPLAIGRFAHTLSQTGNKKVVYHESHDEAGNAAGTDRTVRTAAGGAQADSHARARALLVAGISLFSAGTPMFLFGEEVGVDAPFLYGEILEHRVDLQQLRLGTGRDMFSTYANWIRLRRDHGGLRSRHISVLHAHDENRIIAWCRWADGEDSRWLIVANLANHAYDTGYRLALPRQSQHGKWSIEAASRLAGNDAPAAVMNQSDEAQTTYLELLIPPVSITVLRWYGGSSPTTSPHT